MNEQKKEIFLQNKRHKFYMNVTNNSNTRFFFLLQINNNTEKKRYSLNKHNRNCYVIVCLHALL